MKKNITISKTLFALFIAGALISCDAAKKSKDKDKKTQSENMTQGDTITTASGLKYVITTKGNGAQAAAGKRVKVHYTGQLTNGKVFDSSEDGDPIEFELGVGRVIRGWDEGIALLRVGDKATFVIPGDLAYGAYGSGPDIGPNATLVFHVELVDVVEPAKPETYDVTGKEIKKTSSGLQYVVVKENKSGTKATPGKTVDVHYTGMLVDGSVFDSSIPRGQPYSFQLGAGRVIPGWDEGIALMKTGEKYRLIIPSALGYGAAGAGNGVIPPDATLIFDVELIAVK